MCENDFEKRLIIYHDIKKKMSNPRTGKSLPIGKLPASQQVIQHILEKEKSKLKRSFSTHKFLIMNSSAEEPRDPIVLYTV